MSANTAADRPTLNIFFPGRRFFLYKASPAYVIKAIKPEESDGRYEQVLELRRRYGDR
jgi:hypothetical protein